jgi:Protein of unknown function (DUF3455)
MRRVLATIAAATALAASLMVTGVGAAGATELAPSAQSAATADRNGGGPTPNSKLLPPIQVDETQFKVVSTMRGTGKQVYDCKGGTYALREPVATLASLRGAPTGIHGAGPFWASFDGSKVIGDSTKAASVPQTGTNNVAWLKVSTASNAGLGGVFSTVAFIQRTDTPGGAAPPKCGPPTVAVDYSTYYVFWVPK